MGSARQSDTGRNSLSSIGLWLVGFLVIVINFVALVLVTCSRSTFSWKRQLEQAEIVMTQQERLDWFSTKARTVLRSLDEQDNIIQQIQNRMPSLPGHAAFRCWIQTEPTTDENILVGSWLTGLSATGLMIGETNFTPSAIAWPRYHFQRLPNGVYAYCVAN